jgi:hypothetical protein
VFLYSFVAFLSFQSSKDVYGSIWNYRYQKWKAAPESAKKKEKLEQVTMDFAAAAESYGKIIISEFHPRLLEYTARDLKNDVTLRDEYESYINRMTIKPFDIGAIKLGIYD